MTYLAPLHNFTAEYTLHAISIAHVGQFLSRNSGVCTCNSSLLPQMTEEGGKCRSLRAPSPYQEEWTVPRARTGNAPVWCGHSSLTASLHFFVFTLDGVIVRASLTLTLIRPRLRAIAEVSTGSATRRLTVDRLAGFVESLLKRLA